jgi:septal ring factor EnvC (AmiA/AmiB activator)
MFFVKEQLNEHDKKIEVLERLVEEQNRKLAKLEKKINADNALILE